MQRRDFITLLGGVAAGWPLAARAQQRDDRARVSGILRMLSEALADKIRTFISEIEDQVGSTTQLPWSAGNINQRRFDGLRLLRQVPAVAALGQLDPTGKEQLRVSRLAMDVVQQTDYSQQPRFTEAMANGVYYGPVYFNVRGTYMMLSVAGTARDAGVSAAEVDLALIQELVRSTRVGDHGVAYVVDAQGRVIAHPEMSLVQRDFSGLAHVQSGRAAAAGAVPGHAQVARDIDGREVLATHAPVTKPRLGWLVFVELPVEETDALAQ